MTGGTLAPGDTVRDRKWGGQFVGVVRQVEGRDVFVAWHGTVVEDQLDRDDVELVEEPS